MTTRIGEIYHREIKLRQFFEDWRRERDPDYDPEDEPLLVRTPFVVVEQRGNLSHLILEPNTNTAVRCSDNCEHVGGDSYYGGRSYRRLEAPVVKIQFHRSDRHGDPNNPQTWPHPKPSFSMCCTRHHSSIEIRGWQLVLPGEENKFKKLGSFNDYAILEISQQEFLQFLEGLPCTCRA